MRPPRRCSVSRCTIRIRSTPIARWSCFAASKPRFRRPKRRAWLWRRWQPNIAAWPIGWSAKSRPRNSAARRICPVVRLPSRPSSDGPVPADAWAGTAASRTHFSFRRPLVLRFRRWFNQQRSVPKNRRRQRAISPARSSLDQTEMERRLCRSPGHRRLCPHPDRLHSKPLVVEATARSLHRSMDNCRWPAASPGCRC
jgi:hypothetical protein